MRWVIRVARSGDPTARDRETARSASRARRRLKAIAADEAKHLRGHSPTGYVVEAPFENGIAIYETDTGFLWAGWVSLLADIQDGPGVLATVRGEPLLNAVAELEQLVGIGHG